MRICKLVDFAVPADHRIKLKECEKKDKYVGLARELKKLWNMKARIEAFFLQLTFVWQPFKEKVNR